MLTHCHVLAQNDALEYTRRIGSLPHDDARTHKSVEKCRRHASTLKGRADEKARKLREAARSPGRA